MIWTKYFVNKSEYLRLIFLVQKTKTKTAAVIRVAWLRQSNAPDAVPPVRKADTGEYTNRASQQGEQGEHDNIK